VVAVVGVAAGVVAAGAGAPAGMPAWARKRFRLETSIEKLLKTGPSRTPAACRL
jgi:hypothetical protein